MGLTFLLSSIFFYLLSSIFFYLLLSSSPDTNNPLISLNHHWIIFQSSIISVNNKNENNNNIKDPYNKALPYYNKGVPLAFISNQIIISLYIPPHDLEQVRSTVTWAWQFFFLLLLLLLSSPPSNHLLIIPESSSVLIWRWFNGNSRWLKCCTYLGGIPHFWIKMDHRVITNNQNNGHKMPFIFRYNKVFYLNNLQITINELLNRSHEASPPFHILFYCKPKLCSLLYIKWA